MKIDGHFYELLNKRKLWFSSPADFNDPFDSKLFINSTTNINEVEKYINEVLKMPAIIENYETHLDRPGRLLFLKHDLAKIYQGLVNNLGICCFSANCDNLLLWAHYADCHKGACIQFNTQILKEVFGNIEKVEYHNKYPEIDPFIDLNEAIKKVPFHKSMRWEYEEEIRIINTYKGSFEFPIEAISQIKLGARVFNYSDVWSKIKVEDYNHAEFLTTGIHSDRYEIYINGRHVFKNKESTSLER